MHRGGRARLRRFFRARVSSAADGADSSGFRAQGRNAAGDGLKDPPIRIRAAEVTPSFQEKEGIMTRRWQIAFPG